MIPTSDDLRSDPLEHRYGDIFNPPGLTNFLGVVQADTDLTGFRGLNFPPLAAGDVVTASLFLDGEYFAALGAPIVYTWYPDRIERRAETRGLALESTLILAPGATAALLRMSLTELAGESRDVDVGLLLRGGITSSRQGWGPLPPAEGDNAVTRHESTGVVVHQSGWTAAALAQGIIGHASSFDGTLLRTTVRVTPGAATIVDFIAVMAETEAAAVQQFTSLSRSFAGTLDGARAWWDAQLAAVFAPDNGIYSGSLPELHTEDASIQRLYNNAVVGLLYFRRDTPASVHGRAWDTLMPRYWSTVAFIWDYHLSSLAHALLDPEVMRGYLERWMNVDVHTCFGTEYLGGERVGVWYAVNDYAMVAMANDYLTWSGDLDWLGAAAPGADRSVGDVLEGYARQWQHFRTPSGLADYGEIGNLLECVDTYIHEVASLNAANVWSLRTVADLLREDGERATQLRTEADELVIRVLDLYAQGRGFWHARYPNGTRVEVRHCYDFQTVLTTIAGDLTPAIRSEMAAFFFDELQTPLWMRALSRRDPNAAFSVRPDHQWNGAYPAWPPRAAQALFNAGEGARALAWLRGLARSANQGPFGQAHFVEDAMAPDAGGARKAPPEMPYISDWSCSSSGSWLSVVIESIFGVRATARDGISARPAFFDFDPGARLTGLRYQGRTYTADAVGVHAAE